MQQLLKLGQIANNIEILLGGFFDATYNEHRGPIQIVHQIQRVRSNQFFEHDDFYRTIAEIDYSQYVHRGALGSVMEIVDANTRGWHRETIGRKIELQAAAAWRKEHFSLGDVVWAAYLHVQSGGDPSSRAMNAMNEYVAMTVKEDDGYFHHASEYSVNHLEGKTVLIIATEAIERLKAVS